MTWLRQDGTGVVLALFIKPRASKTRVMGIREDALDVAVAAPPVDGEANAELIHFLSKQLKVPKSQVSVLAGDASRHKRLRIEGVDVARVSAVLAPAS